MSGPELTALDAAFVELDRVGAPLHIGAVSLLEAAPLLDEEGRLRLDDVRALLVERLPLVPRLRSRIDARGDLVHRPRWVDDDDFDVTRHVVATALPTGAGEAEVRAAADALFATPLDLDRPPWRLDFLTGLTGGRVALVQRMHHALVDGVSGVDVALAMFDVDPGGRPPPAEPAPEAGAAPAAEAVASGFHPLATLHRLRTIGAGLVEVLRVGTAPASSLNQRAGAERRTTWAQVPTAGLKAVARSRGARLNDVVLAGVTGGVRELLLDRGEVLAPDARVRVLVPVSRRADDQHDQLGNQVSAIVVDLPVGVGDPEVRLDRISRATAHAKASGEVEASEALMGLLDHLPAASLRIVGPALERQPMANLVVTNVPGPPIPLYVLGAKVLEVFPYVPLAGNLSLGVAVLSYAGTVSFGITADPVGCPDAATFVAGLSASLDALGASWHHLDGSEAAGALR